MQAREREAARRTDALAAATAAARALARKNARRAQDVDSGRADGAADGRVPDDPVVLRRPRGAGPRRHAALVGRRRRGGARASKEE